jgi:hypothetical protein
MVREVWSYIVCWRRNVSSWFSTRLYKTVFESIPSDNSKFISLVGSHGGSQSSSQFREFHSLPLLGSSQISFQVPHPGGSNSTCNIDLTYRKAQQNWYSVRVNLRMRSEVLVLERNVSHRYWMTSVLEVWYSKQIRQFGGCKIISIGRESALYKHGLCSSKHDVVSS